MAERRPIVYQAGYPREIADNDRVKNTGIPRQGTSPTNPEEKDAWLDTNSGHLKVWNAGAWHTPTYIQSLFSDSSPSLSANLNVNGRDIVSSSNGDIDLDPNGSGNVVIKGNSTRGSGAIQLNCENNSHGIKLKSPPHSANASYTLTFPTTAGTNGYALTTNGSGTLAWSDLSPVVTVDGGNFANGSSLVATSSTIDAGAF